MSIEQVQRGERLHRAALRARNVGGVGLFVGVLTDTDAGAWHHICTGLVVLGAGLMGAGVLLTHRRESVWANAFVALGVAGSVGVITSALVQSLNLPPEVIEGGFNSPGMLTFCLFLLVAGDLGITYFVRKPPMP